MKKRIMTFLFGVKAKGEKIETDMLVVKGMCNLSLPPHQPKFTDWCKEMNVCSKYDKNKPIYMG